MEGIGAARVHKIPEVLQRFYGHDAERIRARVEEAGHQLIREHALPPVRVDRAAAPSVLDGHFLTACVRVSANGIESLNGVRAAEIRVILLLSSRRVL